MVFQHAGLLVNEPPGMAGVPFIESSDDINSEFYMTCAQHHAIARFTFYGPLSCLNSKTMIGLLLL